MNKLTFHQKKALRIDFRFVMGYLAIQDSTWDSVQLAQHLIWNPSYCPSMEYVLVWACSPVDDLKRRLNPW